MRFGRYFGRKMFGERVGKPLRGISVLSFFNSGETMVVSVEDTRGPHMYVCLHTGYVWVIDWL